MKVIVLCGGSGTRLEDYSLPKPLNMIYGKPSISHALASIPVDTLHFIVAPHLRKYNFEEVVINEFKTKTCIFSYLPYFTRGPIESAFLGIRDITESDQNIVFLDNDVLYNFPAGLFDRKEHAFLGYAHDTSTSEAFSFLTLDKELRVTAFKEKQRISDMFCCGVYGFKSVEQFRNIAANILARTGEKELYMSMAFQLMLQLGQPIYGVEFPGEIRPIGSLKELRNTWEHIPKPQMRVCFDLDNTLVTYPRVPGDYTTVLPIQPMIDLARKMKSEGHTVIIHTARRMKTHSHNVGAVIRDIGRITFDTLEKFEIPHDELIFGKPYADIYIDDRAVNPYRQDVSSMGYLGPVTPNLPMNSLSPNKHNTLTVEGSVVTKRGLHEFLRGEAFYYQSIPKSSSISPYFAGFVGYEEGCLCIDHISGVPVYTLYKSGLLSIERVDRIFDFIDLLHNRGGSTSITPDNVRRNYIDKLKKRFERTEDYSFEDAAAIQSACLEKLEEYLSGDVQIVSFIHGDLWFSNIIEEFSTGMIKVIDMKGAVDGILTTGGDRLYDYGKLYQSFLGYDSVLNGDEPPNNQEELLDYFLKHVNKRNVPIKDLRSVTFALVVGTLPFIEELDKRQRVWKWIKDMLV
jgi:capsule biosynthesis phosphatase